MSGSETTVETAGVFARAVSSPTPTRFGMLLICALVCCMLVPFLAKPFHIDDPFYIWVAQQIAKKPLDFYGFDVNWQGTPEPAAAVNKNPPLVSHYIAIFGAIAGWSEQVLHFAMLFPAIGLALGTYYLASLMTPRPLLAAAIASVTPVICLSASNVMAETLMLCLYVWAAYFWLLGTERNAFSLLAFAAFLAALSTLTKYFGVTAFPLFAAASIFHVRKPGLWILALLGGIALILAYEGYTYAMYGEAHLFAAAEFAIEHGDKSKINATALQKLLIGFAFLGGCAASVLAYSPFLLRARWIALAALLVVGASVWFAFVGVRFFVLPETIEESPWPYSLQWGVWFVAGTAIVALAAAEFARERTVYTVFLVCAALGTFVFATFVNWSINGRSLILAGPVTAILISRRLSAGRPLEAGLREWRCYAPLVPLMALSLSLNWADYQLSAASQRAAQYYSGLFDGYPGTRWYQGHWGFQYYMDEYGARHFDKNSPQISGGDIMIAHANNTDSFPIHPEAVGGYHYYSVPVCRWLATWNLGLGATFYAHSLGALPYVFGPVGPEEYTGWELNFTGTLELVKLGDDESK